ncbi:hypothetical protein FOZ63_003986 [Perkinsus olseni]|uniref:Uncharacterized protein n=1 Tax=Perkinsus olseni TaxID=32597 RepID=A0A7J6UEY3_PEROL|nr:hypothetical protein FOZ63_003986 [Perkinsus olseni]
MVQSGAPHHQQPPVVAPARPYRSRRSKSARRRRLPPRRTFRVRRRAVGRTSDEEGYSSEDSVVSRRSIEDEGCEKVGTRMALEGGDAAEEWDPRWDEGDSEVSCCESFPSDDVSCGSEFGSVESEEAVVAVRETPLLLSRQRMRITEESSIQSTRSLLSSVRPLLPQPSTPERDITGAEVQWALRRQPGDRSQTDPQGIPWERFAINRFEYRERRVQDFSNYNNVTWNDALEKKRKQAITEMDRVNLCYYRFCRSYRGEPSVWRLNPTVDHFQLRHLTVPTANSIVYLVCNSTLYRYDTLTGEATQMHSQPVHTLSSIDVNRGFAVSGGFDSTIIVTRTHDAQEVLKARMSDASNNITNYSLILPSSGYFSPRVSEDEKPSQRRIIGSMSVDGAASSDGGAEADGEMDDVIMTPLEEDSGHGERRWFPRMDLDGSIFEEHMLRKLPDSVYGQFYEQQAFYRMGCEPLHMIVANNDRVLRDIDVSHGGAIVSEATY